MRSAAAATATSRWHLMSCGKVSAKLQSQRTQIHEIALCAHYSSSSYFFSSSFFSSGKGKGSKGKGRTQAESKDFAKSSSCMQLRLSRCRFSTRGASKTKKQKKGVKTWFCLPEGFALLKGNALSERKEKRKAAHCIFSQRERERDREWEIERERASECEPSPSERLCNVICLLIMLSSL